MKWTDIPHGTITAANQRLWNELGDEASTVATRINTDPGFVTWLAAQAVKPPFDDKWCTSLNMQWLRAREIMGKNFFGVEEAIKIFGVSPSKPQITALAEIPWGEEVLESVRDSHILIAVFPLSIQKIYEKVGHSVFREFDYGSSTQELSFYYYHSDFAKDRGEIGWQLVRKTPVDGSLSKSFEEQEALLAETDETPTARVMVYTIAGHFKATGKRLFKNLYVRTADAEAGGDHINVGYFNTEGLCFTDAWEGSHKHKDRGLASARKS